MVSSVFSTQKPPTRNQAGGVAFAMSNKHALAQAVVTGTFQNTFYDTGQNQLKEVLRLCENVDTSFIAKAALYSRNKGFMKDMPAFLCAVLSVKDGKLLEKIFPKVMSNGKILRNFVQILRSGVVGRKSLGSRPTRLINQWLTNRTDEQLFWDSVGNRPSLSDVMNLSHVKPKDKAREALHGYIKGSPHNEELLPAFIKEFENFKKTLSGDVPRVPFQMLTSLPLKPEHWDAIAKNAGYLQTLMNLNTFKRHGVFDSPEMVRMIANRLSNRENLKKARIFPYRIMSAYVFSEGMPPEICQALHSAMEAATDNISYLGGKIVVCPDVSGSMTFSSTGIRKGATSKIRCIDIAALVTSAITRKHPGTLVLPFEISVVPFSFNPKLPVLENAKQLSRIGGGGTNCSAPLKRLNDDNRDVDLVIYISDNESWANSYGWRKQRVSQSQSEWDRLKTRCPNAKMVCIDIVANHTTQVKERKDVLNIGGFSDAVFDVISLFATANGADHFVDTIEKIEL